MEHAMQQNLSKTDRMVRLILGVMVLGVGGYSRSWWGLLGVLLLVNSVMGVCGFYRLCGISTHKGSRSK